MPSPENHASQPAGGHDHSAAAASRVAAISLAVTFVLLLLKLVAAIASNSVAVLSDAVDSGADLVGGTAALLSVRISRRPADSDHPYGHGKAEALSASVAAAIVAIGGIVVTVQAVRRLLGDEPDINVGVGLVVMAIAVLANLVMSLVMRREAERSGSMALRAESTHLLTNVVQAVMIIAGLVMVLITGEPVFDALMALGLAGYMAWTAVGLVRAALSEVMDEALPDEDQAAIHEILMAHEGEIMGYHELRSRRAGATRHVDMHLTFEPGRTIEDVHRVADHISDEIRRKLPGSVVVIHTEPDHGEPSQDSPGEPPAL
ncbi:MAG: cation diffusion facilitator family transporter [Dehalococcoidia bacterium]